MTANPAILARLEAADGWLALGLPLEAWEELDQLSPDDRAHPQVLAVRVHLFLLLGRNEDAANLARTVVAACPSIAELHFLTARALARTNDLAEAKAHIAIAAELSPRITQTMLDCEDLRAVWQQG